MPASNLESYSTIAISIADEIAHIQLCRPQEMNTMITAFWTELPEAVRYIDEHALARVIVISSQGKHFSAGMDLSVFQNMSASFNGEPARRAEAFRRHVLKLQDAFNALEQVRMPVLVAVQGGVIGGAVDMISACDSRYCTQDAFFCIKETEIGMTPDVGTLQRLPHLIAQGLVRELAYTGRNMMSQEAQSSGLINHVYADQETMLSAVMKIAKTIAGHSPMAVAGCKEMINYSRDHDVADSLNYMATWQSGMLQMPDVMEAMSAGQQKRQPIFENLLPKTIDP
jgi:enoyl-CoA hydratase